MPTTNKRARIWPLSLAQIEAIVSDHLGPGRVSGNEQGSCFSRQISMYLAKHIGGWSTTQIGRFYNGRHHTTVLHAIRKVERLRTVDESFDALVEVLTAALSPEVREHSTERMESKRIATMIEVIAARVLARLAELQRTGIHPPNAGPCSAFGTYSEVGGEPTAAGSSPCDFGRQLVASRCGLTAEKEVLPLYQVRSVCERLPDILFFEIWGSR